jgi:hypothetical protein
VSNPINRDRWNMQDTPESDEERECIKTAAMARAIDRADFLRDEARDRLCVPDEPSPEDLAAEERWRKEDE